MSSRLTLVELLEHSSNCHALHCAREDDCREMKQLIYHSLLCKQVACRVCVEVNSFIITHSTNCTRDCCPVMTCSTLRWVCPHPLAITYPCKLTFTFLQISRAGQRTKSLQAQFQLSRPRYAAELETKVQTEQWSAHESQRNLPVWSLRHA